MPANKKRKATAPADDSALVQERDALAALPTAAIGRMVDIPNGFWGDGHDDGARTRGTVVKAGRTRGVIDFHIAFAVQDGWSTPRVWITLDTLVGLKDVTPTCKQRCQLLEAQPAAAARGKAKGGAAAAKGGGVAATARGKRPAAHAEDGELEDDGYGLLEWVEGFDKAVGIPQRSDARGGIRQPLPTEEPTAITFHKLTNPLEIYEKILKETLRQAEARGVDWDETGGELTLLELKVFLAITMYMNIKPTAVLYDYWSSTKWGDDFVKKHFTRDRFETILSNLHFEDPSERPEPVEEGSDKLEPSARNWKMDAVKKMYADAWRRAGLYTQYLAMDESMIKYRGRKDPRKQRLPSKPIKNGLKAFVLAGAAPSLAPHSPPSRAALAPPSRRPRRPHRPPLASRARQAPSGRFAATSTT